MDSMVKKIDIINPEEVPLFALEFAILDQVKTLSVSIQFAYLKFESKFLSVQPDSSIKSSGMTE